MSDRHDSETRHWLTRPETIRRLWWMFAAVLALTVIAQLAVHIHAHFGADGWFGFYALFGFISCVAMVVFARLLGRLLKRPEDYYEGGPGV